MAPVQTAITGFIVQQRRSSGYEVTDLSRAVLADSLFQPPAGFGREIWEELAEKGFLKRDGGGFYALVPGKS